MYNYTKELEEKRKNIIERLSFVSDKRLVAKLLKAEIDRIDVRLSHLKNRH